MAKSGPPAQVPVYPYYVPGVPAVVPLAPSSHVDPKITSIPSVETNLAGGECRLSSSWNCISNLTNPHVIHRPSSSSLPLTCLTNLSLVHSFFTSIGHPCVCMCVPLHGYVSVYAYVCACVLVPYVCVCPHPQCAVVID